MTSNDNTLSIWLSNLLGGGVVVTTLTGILPGVAASVALIWYLIQIYESATVQRWIAQRRVRRLARLKARVILMEAQGKPALPGPGD